MQETYGDLRGCGKIGSALSPAVESRPRHHLTIVEARAWERSYVALTLHRDPESDAVREVYALIEGLLSAVCAPERPLDLDEAHRILEARGGDLTAPPVRSAS